MSRAFSELVLYQYQNYTKSQIKNLLIKNAYLEYKMTIFGTLQHIET